MEVRHCNGCGARKSPDELRSVRIAAATLAGSEEPAGTLRTDPKKDGELCEDCRAFVFAFVGETPTGRPELVAV